MKFKSEKTSNHICTKFERTSLPSMGVKIIRRRIQRGLFFICCTENYIPFSYKWKNKKSRNATFLFVRSNRKDVGLNCSNRVCHSYMLPADVCFGDSSNSCQVITQSVHATYLRVSKFALIFDLLGIAANDDCVCLCIVQFGVANGC